MAKAPFRLGSILRARCPSCHTGAVMKGLFTFYPRCEKCGYNFNPENGFYLGAMALSYLLIAMLTIPPMIALKVFNVDIAVLIAFPFVEFLVVGPLVIFYARVAWLHLEYRMTDRLDGH